MLTVVCFRSGVRCANMFGHKQRKRLPDHITRTNTSGSGLLRPYLHTAYPITPHHTNYPRCSLRYIQASFSNNVATSALRNTDSVCSELNEWGSV
eukprot:scaffold2418_cov58-Cyclotella_meneghiniana.AAC.3